jgi:hypothetical protein
VHQHAVVEACNCTNLVPTEREDEQPHCVENASARIPYIEAERGLAVGPSSYHPVSALPLKGDGEKEPGGQLASAVLEWWHCEQYVLAQECDDCVYIAVLEGSRKPLNQVLLGSRVRSRGSFAISSARHLMRERRSRSFERARHRIRCRVENLCYLGSAKPEDVAQIRTAR